MKYDRKEARRQSLHRAQHPVGRLEVLRDPFGLHRKASAVSGCTRWSRSLLSQGPTSIAAAWGRIDKLAQIDVLSVLFFTVGSCLHTVGEGKETHPLGLTRQRAGLSCDERKNFLQGKIVKPWNELLKEVVEVTS